ncbi:globin [bacterium]|nr:globin [bacterium]
MSFRIDQQNHFEQLGLEKLIQLSTAFYTRVYADPDPQWRAMFPDDMDSAIQNQYEFFCQRLGGPQLYSQRKGHPALRARHAKFAITPARAEQWLGHMRLALQDVGIEGEQASALLEFFEHTAHFLVNVQEAKE